MNVKDVKPRRSASVIRLNVFNILMLIIIVVFAVMAFWLAEYWILLGSLCAGYGLLMNTACENCGNG